jgi:hypothetical protein
MKKRFRLLSAITALTALPTIQVGIEALLLSRANANTIAITKCPSSGSLSEGTFKATINGSSAAVAGCYAPATSYQILLYEVGICSSSPISGGAFSKASCTIIYSNPSASSYTDIAGTSVDLSSGYIPSADTSTKSYAYVIMNPTIKTAGSYSTTTNSYFSSTTNYMGFSDGRAGVESKSTGPASIFSFNVSSGNGYSACYGGASLNSYDLSFAFLNSSDTVPPVSGGTCSASKVALSMPTNTPIPPSSRLNLRFNVSEYALIVQSYDAVNFPAKAVPAFALGFPLIDIRPQ